MCTDVFSCIFCGKLRLFFLVPFERSVDLTVGTRSVYGSRLMFCL